MFSRRSNPRSVDEMTPGQRTNCARFIMIKDDIQFLDEHEKRPEYREVAVEKTRKLVEDALAMVKDQHVLQLLEFTPLEVARLEKRAEMTREMRIKLRIYVEDYLNENLPSRP